MARLRRARPHPPSLRSAGLQPPTQRVPDLLDLDHAGTVRHAAGARNPVAGGADPAPGDLRVDADRGAGDGGTRARPMRWSSPSLGARFRELLHLDDPPRRLAVALAVGVFISCTPFWGLQTLLAIAVAAVFRFNRAATVLGTWLNVPWLAPFVYGAAIKIGLLVAPGLREADAASFDLLLRDPGALSWATVWSWLRGTSLP